MPFTGIFRRYLNVWLLKEKHKLNILINFPTCFFSTCHFYEILIVHDIITLSHESELETNRCEVTVAQLHLWLGCFRWSFSSVKSRDELPLDCSHKNKKPYHIISICIVNHPSFFQDLRTFALGLFHRLHDTHQGNVGTLRRAKKETGSKISSITTPPYS